MANLELQIGIFGTFDVENYGDLLFPLIAEFELSKRLGPIKLHRFSYWEKTTADWPYAVTSLTELPALARNLDGVLIGGGHVIRFDKDVADGYAPPAPGIHHPTGYWLAPILTALQNGIPVAWNAPGVNHQIPSWADPLMKLAVTGSDYVAVRDKYARQEIARVSPQSEIAVTPDTAFGVSRLLDKTQPSQELVRLREALGINRPYLVVQAVKGLESFVRMVVGHPGLFSEYQLVALPIGPVLGDDAALLREELPDAICPQQWPNPLLLAELIAGAEAAIGTSLHLSITALAFGVPMFRPAGFRGNKYRTLSQFDTIFHFAEPLEPEWFISRFGCAAVSPAVLDVQRKLSSHWDQVADLFANGTTNNQSKEALAVLLQTLPGLLELGDDENRRLQEQLSKRDEAISNLKHSNSWRITSPFRFIARKLRGQKE
ncbi:MAG: polysaccharide pyruvyl transferase family protein [Acidobacteria bacterium]|nr:polysaccharide pyruvyl transferase family protein [Acidobacteriota bacterium]